MSTTLLPGSVFSQFDVKEQDQLENQTDYLQKDFLEKIARRDSISRKAGPIDDELAQGESDLYWENMIGEETLTNFSVTATFVNPLMGTDKPWDFGICFRWKQGADGLLEQMEKVYVDSLSWCYYAPWPDDTVQGRIKIADFNNTPGATTTIDLWVVERKAIVGVNGQYRTTVNPLQYAPVPSGVAVGTGFLPEVRQPGRVIQAKNVEIWRLEVIGAD